MNKYLVKALVAREGKPASFRFVPLEIFDLWKGHMQNSYHYRVTAVEVSLWIAADSPESRQGISDTRAERVAKVSLTKHVGQVGMPVERYFLEEDLDKVLPVFLAHYGILCKDPKAMAGVGIRRGFFLQPEEVFADEY